MATTNISSTPQPKGSFTVDLPDGRNFRIIPELSKLEYDLGLKPDTFENRVREEVASTLKRRGEVNIEDIVVFYLSAHAAPGEPAAGPPVIYKVKDCAKVIEITNNKEP